MSSTDLSMMYPNDTTYHIPNLTLSALNASQECMRDREMGMYFLTSVSTMAAAMVIVLVPRLIMAPCRSRMEQSSSNSEEKLLAEPSMYSNIQNWAGDLISGNNTTGRILVVFAFCCSCAALSIYIYGE